MKRTFEETISLLIGAIIISIGLVLITFSARAEDAPASEKKDDSDMKQTGAKRGDPTIQMENLIDDGEIIIGNAKETTRHFNKENGGITTISTLEAEMPRFSLPEDMRQNLESVDSTSTIILTGDADMHRFSLVGEYVGFLKADKIIFIDNAASGKRLFAIAVGNVEFLRDNIYITSDYAYQDYEKRHVTFEGKENVKITNVEISIGKVIDRMKITANPNKFKDEDNIKRNIDKFYTQASVLSSILSEQIEDDQDEGALDTVWTSVFFYDMITRNQVAKGGVKFYFLHVNPDAASEKAENRTEED